MDTLVLTAQRRSSVGKNANKVRRNDRVPAVLYGHGVDNINLEVDAVPMQKAVRQAGSASLVDLVIDDAKPVKVLIQSVQRHPTKPMISHVDFYQVTMTEKLQTDIELNFIGESAAVKEQGGILVRALDKVKVECLPGDLVPTIDVDISSLKTFDDHIRVANIAAPNGIVILDNPEEIVATVTPPRSDAELEALSQKVEEDVSKVETVEKPKADEEPADDAAKE